MMGCKLIVERPTVTGTRARGTNGPTEFAALAVLSVMVDWMMGLIWVVRDGRLLNFRAMKTGRATRQSARQLQMDRAEFVPWLD